MRRVLLLVVGLSFLTPAVASLPWLQSLAAQAPGASELSERPDVLFIIVDDLNDWVGALGGHPQTRTPNIDELAQRGMLFTNAHTPGAACLPARTALMTGVTAFSSGIYTQTGDWRTNPQLEGLATLPRHFRDNGYLTQGAGKLFHAHTYNADAFEGQQDVTAWDAYYPSLQRQLPDEVQPPVGSTDGDAAGNGLATGGFDFYPTVTEDFAMGDGQVAHWIGQQLEAATGPRYISAGIFRPHLPWYVPQKYFDMHPLDAIELPLYLETDHDDIPDSALFSRIEGTNTPETIGWLSDAASGHLTWRQAVQGYLASVSFADAMVGEILGALDRSGRADNTIIVFVSDHGWHLGEKDRWSKMTLWEEVTRVPFIVVAPGVTTPGSRTDEAVSTHSIYATLTELAGLDTPAHVEGSSLVPLLRDPDMAWDDVAITTFGDYGNFTVRDDRHRYIVYADGQEELYDHERDPNEWRNLADEPEFAEIKADLIARIPPADEHTPPVQ
jgi:arylsulfatase A-like enzyme